jgi:hypothetical protein
VRQVLALEVAAILLESWVHDVLVLAGELVEDDIQAWLAGFLNSRGALKLLSVGIHLRCEGRSRVLLWLTHTGIHVHVAELLRGQGQELLLELLLPLCEIELRRQQLSSDVGVHLAVIVLNRRGR